MTSTEIEVLKERFRNMEKQNQIEHQEVKDLLKLLNDKFDALENKYVTRLEFKSVSAFLWALAVILWIVGFFKK